MDRRRIALVLTILWIVGFELMPWAHIALHEHLAHHHHDESGADVVDDDHDSEVDEHAAHHGHDDDDDDDVNVSDGEVHLLAALAHGAHSFAHHGIAVPVPAPAITTPLPVDRRPIIEPVVVALRPHAADAPVASARGPPCFLG